MAPRRPLSSLPQTDALVAGLFLAAYGLLLCEPVPSLWQWLRLAVGGALFVGLAIVVFPLLRRARGPWWVLAYLHLQFTLGVLLSSWSSTGTGLTLLILLVISQGARAQPLSWMLLTCAMLPLYFLGTRWDEFLRYGGGFLVAGVFMVLITHVAVQEGRNRAIQEGRAEQLDRANQALRAYAEQAEELSTVRERNRIARDIHDGLGHHLTAVHMQLQAAQAVSAQDPARSGRAIEQARALTQAALGEVRRSVGALRTAPPPLPEALALLARDASEAGLEVVLHTVGTPRSLDPAAEQCLYRVAQEGLTNVRKHAQAERADLTLGFGAGGVTLTVHDDGVGSETPLDGFGLPGARERLAALGGELAVEHGPGRGFTLRATVPTGTGPMTTRPITREPA